MSVREIYSLTNTTDTERKKDVQKKRKGRRREKRIEELSKTRERFE